MEDTEFGNGLRASDIHFKMFVKALGREVYVSLHDDGAQKLRDRGVSEKMIITSAVLARLPRAARREIDKRVRKQMRRFQGDLAAGKVEML